METPAWTAMIGAAGALAGALGSQVVAAWVGLRCRRLELYFQAKASAYKDLLGHLGEFAYDPRDEGRYLNFLAAYEVALVFASDEVAELLGGRSGVGVNAQRLRIAETDEERSKVAHTSWYEAAKAASAAMRSDLKRLSAGLQ